MSTEPEISLPAIVIVLRVVGWLMVLSSLIASLLWFALASVIRLLNRIEKRLSHSDSNVSFLSGTTN